MHTLRFAKVITVLVIALERFIFLFCFSFGWACMGLYFGNGMSPTSVHLIWPHPHKSYETDESSQMLNN